VSKNSHSGRPQAVIKNVSYFLAHVPSMVRYGSKPFREIEKDTTVLGTVLDHLQGFEKAVAYPPNQVFIGNLDPDDLTRLERPWYLNPIENSSRWGELGEIMPQDEFYGIMRMCDQFNVMVLKKDFIDRVGSKLKGHPLFSNEDLRNFSESESLAEGQGLDVKEEDALLLYDEGRQPVGYFQRPRGGGAEEDENLIPNILMENLAARASGVMALRHLISKIGSAEDIDYLLGCGEEAVGDRYNRGGGNMAKAIGELCGCVRATGSDVKAFCCAPVHAVVLAAGLIVSEIFRNVVVVAGGSLAKLGMKFQGHVRKDMPILEDVLAGIAILVSRDDRRSPIIRLDSIGKHEIGSGSSQQAIFEKLILQPLDRLGLKVSEIDKYATEMHNPELTEPQGSGNVPKTNYRTIGSFAVLRNEIKRDDLDQFVETHGMPGFSPTQGHIASAVPYLGHSMRKMIQGRMERAMFLAKGSLFLGRMTQLADGISFVLERNHGGQ
jgi:glycine/sarcosine/betaine reductase complex component C subunit beta